MLAFVFMKATRSLRQAPVAFFAPSLLFLAVSFAASAHAAEDQTVIEAQSVTSRSDTVVLSGKASVTRDDTRIAADSIVYAQPTDTVTAKGNTVLTKGPLTVRSQKMSYRLSDESGETADADFAFADNGMRGYTETVAFTQGVTTELTGARLTTCPADQESWWIAADRVEIDDASEYAFVRNASLYAGGVPVAVLPWFAFPATNKRTTGLLLPSVGYSSSKGFEYTQPFYWNIAPNYDYTFTPRIFTGRGVILGNEYRILTEGFKGTFTYDWMPRDSDRHESRYSGSIDLRGRTDAGIRYWVDYRKVSDGQYLRDFTDSAYEGADDIIDQTAGLAYGWKHFTTSLSITKNQVLEREDGTPYAKPYAKAPQWNATMYFADAGGFEISGLAEITRFTHPDKKRVVQGDRFYVNEAVSYPLRGSWWFVTPKVQVTGVGYSLNDFHSLNPSIAKGYDKRSHIFAPSMSLDAGLIFDRDASLWGKALTQTLEPRVFYTYTPHKDQSRMPTFDSSLPDLTFGELFTENLYSGHDRISHTHAVTTALTSRLLDATGYEWMRAAVGQRYYFTDQDVALSGKSTGKGVTTRHTPDYLAAFDLNFTKTLHFTSAAQYSKERSRVTRANAGIRWQPKPSSVVGLYYRYNYAPATPDDHIKQVDFSVQWPLSSNLYGLARYNYSLFEKRAVEVLGGVEYVSNCWAVRLVAQRYLKGDNRYDNKYFLQFELRGLGSVGSSPMETVRRNIPGYEKAAFSR